MHRENNNAYMILVGNPEEKRLLGRPRHTWVDNIIRIIKSRRVSLVGHITCIGRTRMLYDFGGKSRRKETTRKTKGCVGG
jgi:hypothetical protein